jgi:hypothetical protein
MSLHVARTCKLIWHVQRRHWGPPRLEPRHLLYELCEKNCKIDRNEAHARRLAITLNTSISERSNKLLWNEVNSWRTTEIRITVQVSLCLLMRFKSNEIKCHQTQDSQEMGGRHCLNSQLCFALLCFKQNTDCENAKNLIRSISLKMLWDLRFSQRWLRRVSSSGI